MIRVSATCDKDSQCDRVFLDYRRNGSGSSITNHFHDGGREKGEHVCRYFFLSKFKRSTLSFVSAGAAEPTVERDETDLNGTDMNGTDNMLASEGPSGLPRVPRYCLS